MKNRVLAPQVWLLAFLAGPWAAAAGSSPAGEASLSLAEAVQRTLDSHPELQVARLEVDVERARRDFEAQELPVALEAEVENVAGSGAASGIDNAEVTLQLSRVLERGDKPELRYDVGDHRVARARLGEQSTTLALARTATSRFIDVVVLQERAVLAQHSVGIASDTLEFVRARVDAGRSSRAEESIARIELSRAELGRLDIERQLEAARLALVSLWQDSQPHFGRADANVYRLPEPPAYQSLEEQLDNNPEIRRRAAEYQLLQAQRRLADAQPKADVSLSGGVKRLGESGDVGLVFSVSMPFGSAARARPLIEQSELLLEQNPAVARAQMVELRTVLSGLYSELQFARQASTRLQDEIVPEAKNAVRLYEDAYRIGSGTLLELTQAQKGMLALQQELVDSVGRYHATLMEIEYLLGASYEVEP